MSFDCSLSFVRTVYDLVERGELDECESMLTLLIEGTPKTPLHCVFEHKFDQFLPDYSNWLLAGCDTVSTLDSSIAICTSMGEFEINYHNWTADATIHEKYNSPKDPYHWLCESDGPLLCDWFRFTDLVPLNDAFELAFDYDTGDLNATPPFSTELFTAVCYLVYVYFLKLNRQTHELAEEQDLGLAAAHLFCHYGDCLFHSPPRL